jgi:hypothetical protein
VYAH